MRYIKKYNEALGTGSAVEQYSSALIKDVILLSKTQYQVSAYNTYEFEILDSNGEKNKLFFDESFMISALRKVRVFYPTRGSYLTDIDSLRDWKKVFDIIESRIANASEHVKRMDLVAKMFDVVTKEVISEHFADMIDISNSSQISEVKDFDRPLYWNIFLEIPYDISDGGNTLLNDKMRDIFDMIVVNTKRIEEEFGVLTAFRFSAMPTIKTPVIKLSIFAKDSKGQPIGYKLS